MRLEGLYVNKNYNDTNWDRPSDLAICSTAPLTLYHRGPLFLTLYFPQSNNETYQLLCPHLSKDLDPRASEVKTRHMYCTGEGGGGGYCDYTCHVNETENTLSVIQCYSPFPIVRLKKCPTFYRNWQFNIQYTTASRWSVSSNKLIPSTPSHTTKLTIWLQTSTEHIPYGKAGPSGRAVGLRPLACWDCGFECHRGHGCLSVVNVVCIVR